MKKNKLLIILNIILIVFLFIFLIIKPNNFITKGIKDSFYIITKVINTPINYIKEEIIKLRLSNDIYEENKKLKQEIEEIKKIEIENIQLKKDIKKLKENLKLNTILSEYEKINANVVNRNLGYWYDTLIIDKGTKDGIKENQAVITSKGLIGYISSTNYITSTVKLLTSELVNKISVKISYNDKETFGLLTGYKDNYFIIDGITEKIEENALVTTAGLGNNYPEGLYIGKVNEVVTDNFDLIKNLKVKSEVNYDLINIVSVVIK